MFYWSRNDLVYLPFWILVSICITVILFFCLRNKKKEIKYIPLITISAIMFILEIIKQIIAIVNGYTFWSLPLHFCSLFLYLFPIMIYGKGKVHDFGKIMSLCFSAIVFIIYLIGPSRIVGDNGISVFTNFSSFHTVIYHNLIFLYLMLGLALNLFDIKKTDIKYIFIGLIIYASIAIPMAHILNTNYCDLLYNNFEPLQKIRDAITTPVYYILLYILGSLGGVIVSYIKIFFQNLSLKRKENNKIEIKENN